MFLPVPLKGYYSLPLDPNLIAWFSADKVNNVNTALPADTANIASWADIGGKGTIPIQATVANQPVFNTNVANGQPAVTFNSDAGGANGDSVKTNNAAFLNNVDLNLATANTNGFTIFVCAKIANLTPPSGATGCMLFCQATTPVTNSLYEVGQISGGGISFNVVDGSTGIQRGCAAGNVAASTPFIFSGWWDKSNANIQRQINSGSIVDGNGAVTTLAAGAQLFAIGQQKNGQPTRQFDGSIFEILIYSRFFSTSERTAMRTYLGNKYAISV